MAAIIEFGNWNVTLQTAKQSWIISLLTSETVGRVIVEFYRGSALASTRDTFLLFDDGEVGVENYTGLVRVVVKVYDGQMNLIGEGASEIQVNNRDVLPPTAPDFIHYQAQTPTSIAFRWGSSTDDRGVVGYNVYNVAAGLRTRIGTTAAPVTSVTISIDTRTLDKVVVTAVDAYGNESADSPSAFIYQDRVGPKIVFGDWHKSSIEARIDWEIFDNAFVTEVSYTIQAGDKVVGPHYENPIGYANIGIADYEGPVTITVRAKNATGEEAVATSTMMAYSEPPLPPGLSYSNLKPKSVEITLTPPTSGATIAGYILIYSKGVIDLGKDTKVVLQVSPGTRETLYARSYSPDGAMSVLSTPLVLDIPRDPTSPEPVDRQRPVGTLGTLEAMMTSEIRQFLLQLFTDGRMRDPLGRQVLDIPPGFQTLNDFFGLVSGSFGAIIRRERSDEESYLASELIDKVRDPLHKLAIWAERMEHDFVFNLGG